MSVSSLSDVFVIFFFFQAEDGIRDRDVTGVQTCALPIWDDHPHAPVRCARSFCVRRWPFRSVRMVVPRSAHAASWRARSAREALGVAKEIGRASCRERVLIWVAGWWV